MTRSVFRYVRYRLISHPTGGITMTARCLDPQCLWDLAPTSDLSAGGKALMQHTAESRHAMFARTYEDVACVVLADREEQERQAEANQREGAAERAREAAEERHERAAQ